MFVLEEFDRDDLYDYPDLQENYDKILESYEKSVELFNENYSYDVSPRKYFYDFVKRLIGIIEEQKTKKDKCIYINLLFSFMTKFSDIINLNIYREKYKKIIIQKALEFYRTESIPEKTKKILFNFLDVMNLYED